MGQLQRHYIIEMEHKAEKELFRESQKSNTTFTYQATVGTGFEKLAVKELKKKLGEVSNHPDRGRIFFNLDFNSYEEVLKLRSVNNISLIAADFLEVPFSGEDKEKDAGEIKKLVNQIDWQKVLEGWKNITKCTKVFYPTLDQYEKAMKARKEGKSRKRKKSSEKPSPSGSDEILPADQLSQAVREEDNESFCLNDKRDGGASDDLNVLTYRVTCYRSGTHSFQSQEAAEYFGGTLQDKFHWIVDLAYHDLEIVLDVSQKHVYVGLNITKKSLHRRDIHFFGPTTLQPTICFNLLQLANPAAGEVIIDPLCGGGSIPIEGCFGYPLNVYLCGDNSEKAMNRTMNNILFLNKKFNKSLPVDVCKWDCTRLPLRNSVIDIFISDLPFGKRMGSKFQNRGLYKKALIELGRVIIPRTGRAVLLTHDKSAMVKAIPASKGYWNLAHKLSVNIGGLKAAVYYLNRTIEEYKPDS